MAGASRNFVFHLSRYKELIPCEVQRTSAQVSSGIVEDSQDPEDEPCPLDSLESGVEEEQ